MKITWTIFKAMNTPSAWRARFMRNKWILAWAGVVALFVFMVAGTWLFADRPWQGAFMQTLGTAVAMYASLLIFLQSQAANNKALREQMDHIKEQTDKQIAAIAANTNRQITEYSRETLKVVSKLEENSLLLGEILKRNLEESISDFNSRLAQAQTDLSKVESWQPMRTPEQKAAQVANQYTRITQLQQARDYLLTKYHKLRGMFLHNNHLEP